VIKEKNKIRRVGVVKLGDGRSVVERNKGQGARGKEDGERNKGQGERGKEDREKLRSEVIRGKREVG
jgi:hypothetical protein